MSKFTWNYRAFGEQVLTASWMEAEMRRRAEGMLAVAEAIAPFDPADKDGDHYRDHFSVSSGVQHHKTSRAYGRLSNDHPAAVEIEYGTGQPDGSRTPAHHVMLAAIDGARD